MRRYVLHTLVAINAALALGLGWLWVTPAGALRNVKWQPPAAQKTDFAAMLPTLPGVVTTDISQFIAMRERPLFAHTRRPPPPPPPPSVAEQAPVDNLSTARLLGVYQGQGTGGVIVNLGGKDRRVALHSLVDGWTLQSIQGRDVTFTSNGQTRVLQLSRAALANYAGLERPSMAPAQVAPQVPPPAPASTASSAAVPPPPRGTPSFGRSTAPKRPSN